MFCTKCGHPNPAAYRFCSACGAPAFQASPRLASRRSTPRKRFYSRPWFIGCAGLILVLALYSHWERIFHAAGMHSDWFYSLYDGSYGGGLKYTTRDGQTFWNCQYDTVNQELLACDSCTSGDRDRLLAEAENLRKHGNGWRLAEISAAEAVCPPGRELVKDLPDGFMLFCDHQRVVRVVLDPRQCRGEPASHSGVPVDETGANKAGP